MADAGSQIPLLALDGPLADDDAPVTARRRTGPPRQTSKGIAPGDIVEVDRKGRRFHALVTEIDQRDTGRFELTVRPLDQRTTYRTASVREVVAVWRRAPST